jgi:HlyD family secretion protein
MDVARPQRRWARSESKAQALALACGVVLLIALAGWASTAQLARPLPRIARTAVWIDSVRRGELLREVASSGVLVPDQVRWVVARDDAIVHEIHAKPGLQVSAETALVQLSNADLQLKALEAERELKSAAAELVDLRASLEREALGQEAVIAQLSSEQREAARQTRAGEQLAQRDLIADLELVRRREREQELATRLALERRRAANLTGSSRARIQAALEKQERLRALAEYRARQVSELRVVAGLAGVLQELPLQPGQQVRAGALLAKIARPDVLRAELRVAEGAVGEVQVGQAAAVETRAKTLRGHVARVDPAVQQGTVLVDVAIDDPLPPGVRPAQAVEGRIELERLPEALLLGRPASPHVQGRVRLFVLDASGSYAEQRSVRLGAGSVREVAVDDGLAEGERVILSDMSRWDAVERIALY